jgi:predicted nucleic acid-binding protein
VASADQIYVDPSALRSLYLHDDRSARFCAWRRRTHGSLPVTRFGRAELVNSFHLAVHRKYVDRETAFAAAADLEADLREGRLTLVDALWRKTLDLTADLSARHTPRTGTRTLDVLHVATAIVLETTHFATYDKRQAKLAKEVGLRVMTP